MNQTVVQQVKHFSLQVLAKYPRIAFIHVPKCAGVSVYSSLFKAVYPQIFKATSITDYIPLKASQLCERLRHVDMMQAREVMLVNYLANPTKKFVTGHCYAHPNVVEEFSESWRFITVLRDPVDRFISEYVYNRFKQSDWQKTDLDIETYLDSHAAKAKAKTLLRYFADFDEKNQETVNPEEKISQGIANLNRFYSVGFVDEMALWQAQLGNKLGKRIDTRQKNGSPKHDYFAQIKDNPTLVEKITALCEHDIAFYSRLKAIHSLA